MIPLVTSFFIIVELINSGIIHEHPDYLMITPSFLTKVC
jgi:hypothetical protein